MAPGYAMALENLWLQLLGICQGNEDCDRVGSSVAGMKSWGFPWGDWWKVDKVRRKKLGKQKMGELGK